MSGSVIGEEIDGYRIQEVLGRGGMGVVYKAEELALSRPVALKCLNQQLAGDESFLDRFRSEARAIARIDSPYIVQVYTLSETKIGLVIVMEYVEGGTLEQRITAGGNVWEKALPLIKQMLTALQHAHGAEVVHRDIKPQNILLSEGAPTHGTRVKMTDFGLAKVNTSGNPNRTVTQGVYGTLQYMSPEQVEGYGQIDHRSDIYSLGMVCYEMLAGRLPFDEDDSEYTIMRTIVEEDLPDLGNFASSVPEQLRTVVMKALTKDPDERFQSATEMQEALSAFEASSKRGGPASQSSTVAAASPSPEDKKSRTRQEPTEDRDEKEAAASASTARLSAWGRRGIGVGLLLVLLLAGAWYLGGTHLPFSSAPTTAGAESPPDGEAPSEDVVSEQPDRDGPEDETTDTGPDERAAGQDSVDETTASANVSGGAGPSSSAASTPDGQGPSVQGQPEGTGTDEGAPVSESDDVDSDSLSPDETTRRVERLVQKVKNTLEAGRLTTPDGERAYDLVTEILDLDPDNEAARSLERQIAQQYVQKADEAEALGNVRQAVHYLETSLSIRSQPSTRKKFEALRSQREEKEEIQQMLDQSRATLDGSPSAAELEEVIATVKKVLERTDRNEEAKSLLAEAWSSRGRMLAAGRRFAEAIDSYDRALEVDTSMAATWYNRGLALYRQKRFGEAIESYDRALKINPSFAAAWTNRGLALLRQQRFSDAVDSFDRALEDDASNAAAWHNRGDALAAQGRFEEAIDSYEQALKADSSLAEAWYNRSRALEKQGRDAEARKSLERACQLDPSFENC